MERISQVEIRERNAWKWYRKIKPTVRVKTELFYNIYMMKIRNS